MKTLHTKILTYLVLAFLALLAASALGLFPFVNAWYRSKYWFYNNAQVVGEFQGRTSDPLLGTLTPSSSCSGPSDCQGGNCLFVADEGTSFHLLPCHNASTCRGRCDPLKTSPGIRRVVVKGKLRVATN